MTMIERVARAMLEKGPSNRSGLTWERAVGTSRVMYRKRARIAIEAMREPTEAMCEAGADADMPGGRWGEPTFRESTIDDADAFAIWRAMIAAALGEDKP